MKKSLLSLGIVLVLFNSSPAQSQDNDVLAQFKREADLQGYKILALSCLEFKLLTSAEFDSFEWTLSDVGLTVPAGNPSSVDFMTQVHLPDGAEIKRMVAVYYDNSVLANIEIYMAIIEPLSLEEPEAMFYFTSEGLANNTNIRTYSTTSIFYPVIDNRNIYAAAVSFDEETNLDVAFRCLYIAYQ